MPPRAVFKQVVRGIVKFGDLAIEQQFPAT